MRRALLLAVVAAVVGAGSCAGAGAGRLLCYTDDPSKEGYGDCTHLVYTGQARGEKLEELLGEFKKYNPRIKTLIRINDDDQTNLRAITKSKLVQGLEISDAHRTLNRTKVQETVQSARTALSTTGGGPLYLSLPPHPELLAKYYDLRSLVKIADLMVVATHDLGAVNKMTYHPSRLSGMWDMMNTDSVVDLVIGLGVPASKLIISLPATAQQFTLANETLSTPGSPAKDDDPKAIDQAELCRLLQKGKWTLERDQDLSAPYAFKDKTWIAFEDPSSIDVKGKYARVRGLAGLALQNADRDAETPCGLSLKSALAKVLNQQSRAPRAAVLRSLEQEILSAPAYGRSLDALQVSPYRITQVVDSDGVIHSIREDTRTEFSCSRQGYFVHPRSCGRFYRCVKFDQLSPDYTVFEFDCPAGLAFDSRHEVCVWPGSLPGEACPGSSEIAPVPKARFVCPAHEGYYADPENCRWFFACLDHGLPALSAYEFRCPFGLGFDEVNLKCDWPWLVPGCGHVGRYEAQTFGFSGALLTGAAGYSGQRADAINIAAHQSLASGAALTNHVGLQHGLLASDALDANFIASQQAAAGLAQQSIGLVQPTNYKEEKYTSGSLILDEYRLPKSKTVSAYATNNFAGGYNTQYAKAAAYSDNSGAYVHDPSGDYAEPYRHINSPAVPYLHEDSKYNEYQDYGLYTDSNEGKYASDSSGAYVHDNSGAYRGDASFASDSYKADYSGAYNADYSGKYVAGVYQSGSASYNDKSASSKYYGSYGSASNGGYLADSKVYTGASHALTAGAVNVGFVGKTTLVETPYIAQENYQQQDIGYKAASAHSFNTNHGYQANVQSYVSQPAVSITHVGTDSHNLDGYEYATTPTTSGIPTTATPFAVTTPAVPTVTYKTTFLPEPPKTDVKQVFYSQPAVTYVRPTVVPVTKYVPKVEVTDYNQAIDYQVYESKTNVQNVAVKHESSGYVYDKPSIKFEEGVTTYTTPAPAIEVSTYKPQSISHATVHQSAAVDFEYARPLAVEEPFKKVVAYTTGPSYVTEPSVPTYSQSISHQTVHNVNSANIAYAQAEEASVHQYSNQEIAYEAPRAQENYVTVQPPVTSTYTPQVYNEQTVHEVDINRVNTYHADNSGYQYSKPVQTGYQYDKPVEQFVEAPKPVQVTSVPVYKPQSYSQQTVHTYQQQSQVPVTSTPQPKIQLYQQPSVTIQTGYQYDKPVEQFVEAPKPVQVSSVPVYKPQSYSQQTVHTYQQQSQEPVISTPQPKIQLYKQPAVTIYENPIIKYTQKEVEPITYVKPTAQIYSQTYQPIVQKQEVEHVKPVQYVQQQTYNLNQGYTYNQPEIQRNVEVFNTVKYSQANEVSHQVFHQSNAKVQHETQNNNFVTVTTSPATLAYEEHYVEYETPKKVETYKAPEYVPPKTVYQESYVSSTPSTPLVHKSYVSQTQDQFDYKGVEYAQQYELSQKAIPQVSFTTTHQEPKKVESYHISSYPGSTVATIHQSPEIQVGYQEYLPPAVSYKPVTSTYRPTVSTTKEYLPPTPDYNDREYLPPNVENTYSPSTTAKTLVEINFKNQEYLPPQETYVPVSTTSKPIVRYEYNAPDYLPPKVETTYLPPSTTPREYLPPSSPREYLPPSTTPREYLPPSTSPREYLPPSTTPREYLPPSTTARPVTSTTPSTTTYKFVETTFKAPEYLPPQEEDEHFVSYDSFGLKNDYTASSKIKYNPYQIFTDDEEVVVSTTKAPVTRKQNIVVEHAKSNLLGFGTVGPDAGLVSPVTYTTYGPVSSTESYTARPKFATSTYPSTQGLIEVTPTSIPARRVKPKVAVVTKINDYNPLLVRKLGAVCSCQAPVVVLRGRRPSIQKQSDYDYSAEYDDSYERGDVEEITRKVERIRPGRVKTVTSTTFNPIIVPDDSYYDDYVEPIEVSSKKAYSENYISTTPAYSTTEQVIKLRPRVKSVTVAPTYKTVILDSASTAAPIVKAAAPRGRDELLAGIECQRAGLFRHPKHCNKFYACRWDCDKQRFTLHTFNCPIQLSFDPSLGACNWPSQGPACQGDTLLSNTL